MDSLSHTPRKHIQIKIRSRKVLQQSSVPEVQPNRMVLRCKSTSAPLAQIAPKLYSQIVKHTYIRLDFE
jgi:hypothetical protein